MNRKDLFDLPKGTIYMAGHSLGPTPRLVKEALVQGVQEWSQKGVLAWNKSGWMEMFYTLGGKLAPLIGVNLSEIIVTETTSINLFKAIKSALKINSNRRKILTSSDNFPADLYVIQGIAQFNNDIEVRIADNIVPEMNEEVAVLVLTHINYRTGIAYDMKKITNLAHSMGVIVIWDLAHTAGIFPVNLRDCNVDFAVGCCYKYLNGGPGAPGFIYCNSKYNDTALSPIFGWLGHASPFTFASNYIPAPGVMGYFVSTPSIFAYKALEVALNIFDDINIADLHSATVQNAQYFIQGLQDMELKSIPIDPYTCGGHISIYHEYGYTISRALIDNGVTCDYREPNTIRFCINPLYISYEDIDRCLEVVSRVLESRLYLKSCYSVRLSRVT